MHHRKPSISISEVVTDANKTQIFLSDFRIADVLKTADYRVWCLDESTERATREAFQASENVPIKLKDLSQTPSKQEKRLDSSDLIIIPTILLTTRQFQQILQNAGQLLTSDGRLCLTVPVQQSQDIVALGQAAGLTEWIKFSDFKDPSEQQLTLLIGSSNTKPANGTQKDDEIIILQSPAPSQAVADVAAQLKKTFSSLGYTTFFVSWGSSGALSLKGKTLISLVELDSSILQNPEEDEFAQVKALILESKSVLWISSLHNPISALITGLSRVVRNEEPGLSFRTLNANLSSLESADRLAEHVLRVFQSSSGDNEFKVENDIIYISRVVEDDVLNGELNLLDPGKNKTIAQVTLGEAGPLKLCIQNSGLLDSFYFEHDPIPSRDLEADKIEIMVKAASVK
jgi:hypothetical protein